MNGSQWIFLLAAVLGAGGIWVMLAFASLRERMIGFLLAAVGLGMLAAQLPMVDGWISGSIFYVLATITVASAVATISMRNPIYSAIWFGMTLLGVAGLFLLEGAQFLAVATVVVYAGAILVTFLFVIMLAQPEGKAHYDRIPWEALLSAFSGMVIVAILSMAIVGVLTETTEAPALERTEGILAEQHVAAIGRELFGPQLIAVEVAGVLLLAALVGAAAIVMHTRGTLTDSFASPTASEDASPKEPDHA